MTKLKLDFIVVIFFLLITVPSIAQLNKQAARDLIARIIPKQAEHFEVEYVPKENDMDVFEVESVQGKIILGGNNAVSVASALNYYLRNYCHCLITWNGVNLRMPKLLPKVIIKVHQTSPYKYRYYLNQCTFNYTMSWWNWDRWQKEIDWMALNGINMPLSITGEEAIWQKVYKQLGFTDKDLENFFPGPAYFAWFWMSNLDGWGGPLPQHWIDTHKSLQKKIFSREQDFGMTPVLPAFSGHVPSAFKEKFPNAKINHVSWACNFPAVNILSPDDSLFAIIGKKFIEEQTKEYGTSHYYAADLFNEMTPPHKDSMYLNDISQSVYHSMQAADPDAIWVMQGWLFHYAADFWKSSQIKALLNAIPNDKMIILDLWSEANPVWNKTEAYYGKPWIWNMLHNFGGANFLGGCFPCVADKPALLLNDPKAGKLKGMGLTMEGTLQNPALYQFMLDNTWRNSPANAENWIKDYLLQRYGSANENALKAWQILLRTVYANNETGASSAVTGSPSISNKQKSLKELLNYDPNELLLAWKLMLKAADSLGNNDGFQFDLVDLSRQILDDYGLLIRQEFSLAFTNGDLLSFQKYSNQFLTLSKDMDQLLASRQDFLLGAWLKDAKSWGISQQEKNLYEFNARNLITLWGQKDCSLHDYAMKEWSGLLQGFCMQRWKQFFGYASAKLKTGSPLNMEFFNLHLEDWEEKWVHGHELYDDKPKGNPIEISKNLFNSYSKKIGKI